MFFLNPTYLWALTGLLVPIAIHLWSKREGKTIKIGSIQLLTEADSKQNSSIKLNELWLLLLRLFLIALVVLIMAEPQIKRDIKNVKLTYLVEPSLLNNKALTKIMDTISSEASLRLLQNDFPEFELDDVPKISQTAPKYWQLAKEMNNLHADSIIVFTKSLLKGLRGKRPEISSNIQWIVIDESETSQNIIRATVKEKNVELLSVVANSQSLSFKNDLIPSNSNSLEWNNTKDSIKIKDDWLATKLVTSFNVLIFEDTKFEKEATYIDAAFKAISKYTNHPIEIKNRKQDTTNLDTTTYDIVVWLSDQTVPTISKKILTFSPDAFASSLIIDGTTDNVFHLTKKLNSENVINEHLAEQLTKVLDLHSDLEGIISKNDKRIASKDELQPVSKEVKLSKNYASVINISKWLWALLASVLVIERIVANYRKQ